MVVLDTGTSVRVSVSSPGDRGQLLRQSSVVCLPDETRDAEVAGNESAETSRSMYP